MIDEHFTPEYARNEELKDNKDYHSDNCFTFFAQMKEILRVH